MPKERKRCPWVSLSDPLSVDYHDREWGRPVRDDRVLFEYLILEGAQAGLSWHTILHKRENYRKAFAGFDPKRVARFTAADCKKLLANPGIVRNRLKIASSVTNARLFLEVQKEWGSFAKYLWSFSEGKVVHPTKPRVALGDYPAKTELSDRISRDLKKRGFRFVGSTIVYAYLQAVGIVNDHARGCFRYGK